MSDNHSRVIILAAGEGKRLHPLTLDKPKCLVEIFGKKRDFLLSKNRDLFYPKTGIFGKIPVFNKKSGTKNRKNRAYTHKKKPG